MKSKVSGILLLFILALAAFLITVPTQAHFTVGRPTGTSPYRVRDFDPHVPGPTGYVWPGSGVMTLSQVPTPPSGTQNWGSGAPSPVTWAQGAMLPPGYQSPFSTNPPGAPCSWLQLAGNAYAPFGAILTSTDDRDNVGDFIFGINFTTINDVFPPSGSGDYNYHSLTIYIPPEFSPPVDWTGADTSNIVTTITNEYGSIYVWKADIKDPFGPGWWVIYISPDQGSYGILSSPRGILFSQYNSYNEWYYVRVNGMKAPSIAGRYVFKMFLDDSYPIMNTVAADGSSRIETTITTASYPSTMPVENWPVMLVKGEVDPGIVEGVVRYGAWNQQLYNLPIQLPGRVRAVGIADDPYTGASTGRAVEARGYFNATAKGHYEIEGVAPGVYDIYASAAGYPETKVASGVKIISGKSFHLDFLLQPGPIITGVLYSKHSFGEVAWPSTRPVTVEIYDSNEWPAAKPGYDWDSAGMNFEMGTGEVWTDVGYKVPDAHLKSFSPINLTDSPFTSYVVGNVRYASSTGYTRLTGEPGVTDPNHDAPKQVAFPWEGPHGITPPQVTWVNGQPASTEYTQEALPEDTTTDKDIFGVFNGVGPAQYWWVDKAGLWTNGGGSNSFRYQFGIKGFYGAPMEYDGHVPQVFATWVNGMTSGTYYTRAWINGYVQTDVSGTYMDYPFTVAGNEWAGDINTPMDLETSSWINKTVHFHDLPGTLQTNPIKGPDPWRYLIAEAYDADNVLVAMNFTQVPSTARDYNVTMNGFGMEGPIDTVASSFGTYVGVPQGMKFFLYRYRHIRDYGIMPGTYTIRVYMRGYVQQEFEMATISLSSSPAHISNHMYRGAGINVTLYSIDWEHPRVDRPWNFPGEYVRVNVYDDQDNSKGYVRYFDRTLSQWVTPAQRAGSTVIPSRDWSSSWTKLKFNGSDYLERQGPDSQGWLIGNRWQIQFGLDGSPGKWDAQTGIWLELGFGLMDSSLVRICIALVASKRKSHLKPAYT